MAALSFAAIPCLTMDTSTSPSTLPDWPAWPAWARALTSDDFALHGYTVSSPAAGLTALTMADEIDLSRVSCCLDLLRSDAYLLHAGSPLALMSYSPALCLYRACFDGAIDLEPALLTEAQAGLWLALLAPDVPLPTHPSDWGVIRLQRDASGQVRLTGQDALAIEVYQAHADDTSPVDPDDYDAWISRAVWTCIQHALDAHASATPTQINAIS